MKKTLSVLVMIALAFSLFVVCAAEAQGAKNDAVKIALIIENTIDDKGWCQAMYDGLVDAKAQLGDRMEFDYSEKMKPVDAGSIARQYVADGYDLIIAHGALQCYALSAPHVAYKRCYLVSRLRKCGARPPIFGNV